MLIQVIPKRGGEPFSSFIKCFINGERINMVNTYKNEIRKKKEHLQLSKLPVFFRTYMHFLIFRKWMIRFLQIGKFINSTPDKDRGVEWARERCSPKKWWVLDPSSPCPCLLISPGHGLLFSSFLSFCWRSGLDRDSPDRTEKTPRLVEQNRPEAGQHCGKLKFAIFRIIQRAWDMTSFVRKPAFHTVVA